MSAAPAAGGTRLSSWLAALIAACVLPLLLVAAWLAREGVQAQQRERQRELAAKAQNVAMAIDRTLQAHLAGLQMLADSPLFADPSRWAELHREALAFFSGFGSHVQLAGPGASPDEPMRMLLNTRVPFGTPLPPLPRPAGRAAVPLALQTGRPAVGDLFAGPIAGEPLVALALPLPGGSGGRGLVLLTSLEARRFQQQIDQVAMAPGWALSLLDSRGEVIARRAPAGFAAAPEDAPDGRHRITLAGAPWRVQIEVPPQEWQAPRRQATLALALVIAATTLLAAGGGALAARRLRRGVAALAVPGEAGIARSGIVEIEQARQQLDAALAAERSARTQLQATFDLANVGIAHVAPDGRWLRVNSRLCRIVGYSEAELLATTLQAITAPDDLTAHLALMRQLAAGEIAACETDQRCLRRDGQLIWAAVAVTPVRRPNGAPDYFIAVIEDIDARKQLEQRNREQFEALARNEAEGRQLLALAERSRGALLNALQDQKLAAEALRASEARLRNLFEQASDGIYVIDAANRYLDANARGLAMLGWSRDELLQRGVADMLAPHEVARLAVEPPRMMDGEPHFAEWDHRRRDGSTFPGEVSAKRLDEHSYLAIVRDISERRRIEQTLLQHQLELSQLTQQLMAQERATTRRVAQALHDRLGQTLALARLRLGAIAMRQAQATLQEREAALAQLGLVLEQAVAEARQVLAELRPPLLDEQGLAAALDNELRSPALAGGAGVVLELEVAPPAQQQRWPGDAEYAAFMITREAIANALRHAEAGHVVVRLDGGAQWLRLHIDDDGIGLGPELAHGRPGHLGIVGMRERALAIGAQFTLARRAAGGTRATLVWGVPSR